MHFFFYGYAHHLDLHSFPTRRSSDLVVLPVAAQGLRQQEVTIGAGGDGGQVGAQVVADRREVLALQGLFGQLPPSRRFPDRKSTRLNSSHPSISYAVFCLKKKNTTKA